MAPLPVIIFDFGIFGAEAPLGIPILVDAQLIEALAEGDFNTIK